MRVATSITNCVLLGKTTLVGLRAKSGSLELENKSLRDKFKNLHKEQRQVQKEQTVIEETVCAWQAAVCRWFLMVVSLQMVRLYARVQSVYVCVHAMSCGADCGLANKGCGSAAPQVWAVD